MKRSVVSNKIWRTIVVAGAMLATPLAGCGGNDKKADTTPTPTPTEQKPADDDPESHGITEESAAAQAKFEEEHEKAAAEEQAKKEAEAKAAAEAQAKKEADEKAAAEEQAKKDEEAKKARPRTKPTRPTGRGFILS